jgi:hypothetical protein
MISCVCVLCMLSALWQESKRKVYAVFLSLALKNNSKNKPVFFFFWRIHQAWISLIKFKIYVYKFAVQNSGGFQYMYFLFVCLFLRDGELEFEVRSLHLPGTHSMAWVTSLAFFALVILEIECCFLPRLAWTAVLLFYASCHCWDDRHMLPA